MGGTRGLRVLRTTALGLALVAEFPSASADTFHAGPADDIDSIEATVNALRPGDELVLAGGSYTLGGRFSIDVVGTEDEPIVIRGADGQVPHLHRPNAGENIIDVDRAEYLTLRGIELSGGSAGIRISSARFFTIEECEVHGTGDVAVRANDAGVTYTALRILRNHIHHTNNTGEGMYLGCNDADCEVVDSLIEGNYIHHTDQPTVTQGDGIEIKEGSAGNVVRDNVIHDTHYPCILTYATNGAPNVIERNVMWNCGDHGIQSAADAVVRNNIVLSASADGIAMQPHQAGSPSNLRVVHNTVLNAGRDAMSLRGIAGSVLVANNALYAQTGSAFFADGTSGLLFEGNVGVGGASLELTPGDLADDFVDASYAGAPPLDVFPESGGALPGSGIASHVTEDDFNGTPRMGVADVGAYALADSGNPGWPIVAGFKSIGSADGGAGPGGTGGAPSGAGGSSGEGPGGGGHAPGPSATTGSSGCAVHGSGNDVGWLLVVVVLLRCRPSYRRAVFPRKTSPCKTSQGRMEDRLSQSTRKFPGTDLGAGFARTESENTRFRK